MYGGNTKYHSNPYIQGTTVPCDAGITGRYKPGNLKNCVFGQVFNSVLTGSV